MTYFRGDRTSQGILVDKVDRITEGPDKGKVASFTVIRAIDATIFDDHRGNDYAIIVASGPGDMEARPGPGLNGPIERTAHWNDRLTIQPLVPARGSRRGRGGRGGLRGEEGRPGARPPRPQAGHADRQAGVRRHPRQGHARRPRPAQHDRHLAQAQGPGRRRRRTPRRPARAPSASGAYEIEHLTATNDVLLVTPGRTLTARNDLQAEFKSFDDQP